MGLRHRQVLWVLSCARSTLADVGVGLHLGLRLSIVGYLIPVCFLAFVGSSKFCLKLLSSRGFVPSECV